jgi:hypothetical protein
VPCGPGGAQGYASDLIGNQGVGFTASSQTVTALANDASGATLPATLTMTVVSSGGL